MAESASTDCGGVGGVALIGHLVRSSDGPLAAAPEGAIDSSAPGTGASMVCWQTFTCPSHVARARLLKEAGPGVTRVSPEAGHTRRVSQPRASSARPYCRSS